jgi:membrane protease YdiL (CAAX protease family)
VHAECELDARRAAPLPAWHPLLLIGLMLAVAVTGFFLREQGEMPAVAPSSRIAQAYVPMLVVSWGLFLYVCRVGRSRSALGDLLGAGDYSARRVVLDIFWGLAVAVALVLAERGWQFAGGGARNAHVGALLPVTGAEHAVWCAVALSTALSEEVVYRGYLARELTRLSGRPAVGLVGQAVLFALAHGEQGGGAMARFFVYAVGLALVAAARRSLVPGIVGHASVNLLAGLTH